MATTYTQQQLQGYAVMAAREIKKKTGRGRLIDWRILVGAGGSSLVATVLAADGMQDRYVAI